MSGSNTFGFDTILELDETELLPVLRELAPTVVAPQSHALPFGDDNGSGLAVLHQVRLAEVQLQPPTTDLVLRFAFNGIQFQATRGGLNFAGLVPQRGTITLPVSLTRTPDRGRIRLEFVSRDAPVTTNPSNAFTATIPMSLQGVVDYLFRWFTSALANLPVEVLPLSLLHLDTVASTDSCDLVPRDLQVAVPQSGGTGRRSLALLIKSREASRPSAYTGTVGTTAERSVRLLLANDYLLDTVVCRLAPLYGLAPEDLGSSFDRDGSRCREFTGNRQVTLNVPGHPPTTAELRRLTFCVGTGGITISGQLFKSNLVAYNEVDFSCGLDIRCSGGRLEIAPRPPRITENRGLWVLAVVIGIALVVVFYAFAGVLAALLVLAVEIVVAIALSNELSILTAIGADALRAVPGFPPELVRLVGALRPLSCVFDDLEIGARKAPLAPEVVAASRRTLVPVGWAIDLDTGTLVPPAASGDQSRPVDIAWLGGAAGVRTAGGARLALMSATYDAITAETLRRIRFHPGGTVPAARIPTGGDWANAVVFAVRTNQGRLAKCAALRDPSGAVLLRYAVYVQSGPHVTINTGQMVITSRSDAGTTAFGPRVRVARRGSFSCTTHGFPASSQVEWSLGPHTLGSGDVEGTIDIDGRSVRFDVSGRHCILMTNEGDDLTADLCATARDAGVGEATACVGVRWLGEITDTSRLEETLQGFEGIAQLLASERVFVWRGPQPDPPPFAVVREMEAAFDSARLRGFKHPEVEPLG